MGNVAIVVGDVGAAVAFFTELGMELEGKGQVKGLWADRTVALDGVRSDITMMRTPDGHGKLELTKYHAPRRWAPGRSTRRPTPWACVASCSPSTASDDTVARLRAHGAELFGEVARYKSIFRPATCAAPRASSSHWLNRSADASLQEGTTRPCSMQARTDGLLAKW